MAGHRPRARSQRPLDRIRGCARVGSRYQGGSAGDDGGRHRRPRTLEVGPCGGIAWNHRRRVSCVDGGPWIAGRNRVSAGGQQVGLADGLGFAGERGDRVAGAVRPAVGGEGPDSDDPGIIARTGDRAGTVVSGGGDDRDARSPGGLDCPIERVDVYRQLVGGRERQVHNPKVELLSVSDRPTDPPNDLGEAGRSVSPGHLDRDNMGPRRHSQVVDAPAGARGAVTTDEAGHERAVSVLVEPGTRTRQVRTTNHMVDQVRFSPHASIDEGDPDVGAPTRGPGRAQVDSLKLWSGGRQVKAGRGHSHRQVGYDSDTW